MALANESISAGRSLLQAGRLEEAEQAFQQILAADAHQTAAWHLRGVVAFRRGKCEEAIEFIRQALALNADHAEAHNDLGVVLQAVGGLAEARASYQRAIQLRPDHVDAHFNLGVVCKELSLFADAVACYRRALELRPQDAQALNNLGIVLREQGQSDEAAASYQRAIELQPDFAEAHNNLGIVHRDQGRLTEAVSCYLRSIQSNPANAIAHHNLGNVLRDWGQVNEAVAAYRRAVALKPDYSQAHSNALLTMQYCPGVTLAGLVAAHADFEQKHAAAHRGSWPPHANTRDPERRLRVGFVSADLGEHPVGYFAIRGLEHLDRSQVELFFYSDRQESDSLTNRFRASATVWRDTAAWTDDQLAEQIRADQIDILLDLAGHTANNRLLVFARKPAPIQVTWLGYVGTTGFTAIDYILADRYEIPHEQEPFYRERVLRLPDGYVCYDPPSYAPPVTPLPALQNGHITFGSFNNPAKINAGVVAVWASILRCVQRSRLVLKFKCVDELSLIRRFAAEFAAAGVDPTRVEYRGWSPHAQTLAEYADIDVALDPFPYGGGLTTCEALWMGVPVITCPGQTFASRHSLSHLSNAGLTETIASSMNEYVEMAVAWAHDLPRLAALRSGLRERMASSSLCDGVRFADNLLRLLRQAWREWCQLEG